jgi:hypothetical protein
MSNNPWRTIGRSARTETLPPVPDSPKAFIESTDDIKMTSDDLFRRSGDTPYTVLSEVQDMVASKSRDMSDQDEIHTLCNIARHATDKLVTCLKKVYTTSYNIKDDQTKIVYLNKFETAGVQAIKDNMERISACIHNNKTLCDDSIENIRKFLQTVGVGDAETPEPSTETPDLMWGNVSELIVVDPVQHMVKMGPVRARVASSARLIDIHHMSMKYYDPFQVFIINIGEMCFTAGPGNFVDLKKRKTVSTNLAKRCFNSRPCGFDNCKYYHDPLLAPTHYNYRRNMTVSYVTRLLKCIKNDNDLVNNSQTFTLEYLQDLVQAAGIMLYKAHQIKEMYFKNTTQR